MPTVYNVGNIDSMVKLVNGPNPAKQQATSTTRPVVYGNPIDLEAAKKYLDPNQYTFVDTSQLKSPITFKPGDIVVGGTGATGGVASADIGPALRLAGANRTATEQAIKNYADSIASQNEYINQRMAAVQSALQRQYDQQQLALQQNLANTLQAYNTAKTNANNQYEAALRALEAQKQATLPQFQQQMNQADVSKAQNIQQLRNTMAQLGLLKGGDTVTGLVNIQAQRENAINAINQAKNQYLTEMDNQHAALQAEHAATISDLEQKMALAQQQTSEQSKLLANQLAQQLAEEQIKAQIDYQNYLTARQDAERQFALQEAQLTGQYQGQPTFEAQQAAIQRALQEAQLTGIYNGRPTLDAQQMAINRALQEAQLTGIYNGRPTLDAQQLAAQIAAQQAQQALAQQEFGFNKWLQQQKLALDKQSTEAQIASQKLRDNLAQMEALTPKQTSAQQKQNLLADIYSDIYKMMQQGASPNEIADAMIKKAPDWIRQGLTVSDIQNLYDYASGNLINTQQNNSLLDQIKKKLGINPNTPSGGKTTTSSLGKTVTSGNSTLDNMIASAAKIAGIPANILAALVKAESNFNQNARSKAGAIGLTQLMPSTAKALGVNPYDAWENLLGGAKYLAQQFKTFGDWAKALAAYNAGPGNVKKYGGIPPFKETQNYVKRIFGYLGWG